MNEISFCMENFLSIIAQNDILKKANHKKKLEFDNLFNDFQNYKNGKVINFVRYFYLR